MCTWIFWGFETISIEVKRIVFGIMFKLIAAAASKCSLLLQNFAQNLVNLILLRFITFFQLRNGGRTRVHIVKFFNSIIEICSWSEFSYWTNKSRKLRNRKIPKTEFISSGVLPVWRKILTISIGICSL